MKSRGSKGTAALPIVVLCLLAALVTGMPQVAAAEVPSRAGGVTAGAPTPMETAPHRDRASIASEPAQRAAISAAAADPVGCGYGQGGKYDDTICWLDMTSYNDTQARSNAGQNMSVTLPGGYTLGYNIKTTVVPGRTLRAVAPVTTPIETRFAFGSEAYRNIPGRPSLYSAPGANTGIDVTLSGIRLADSSGNPVSSFSFVATDTEDNVAAAGESLRWTSDKQLNLLETLYPSTTKGCVPANITGLGTTEVNCVGAGGASTLAAKSTSILVSADAPSTFALRWLTSARSGIAFGVNTASVSVSKVVGNRVASTDSFDVAVKSPEGSTLATATTGAATSASTGRIVVIPAANGGAFTLTDAATPNTGTDLGSYARSWSCTRNGEPDPNLPSGDGASVQVSPAPNESIACTVTNTGFADYGDALNAYGTLAANSGARHSVFDYDVDARTASLMMGASVDAEVDGLPGPQAAGDDEAAADDEDGVTPLSLTGNQQGTVTVQVTNTRNEEATLAGWLDLDADGVFEAGERVTAAIPADVGTVTRQLTFPFATARGATSARFRLFAGTVAAPLPTGAAVGGEVEDYPVSIESPIVTCTSDPAMFNTAYDGNGGKLAPGARDRNWEQGAGSANGPATVTTWVPAYVVNIPSAWYPGEFGSSSWIAHSTTGAHNNSANLYFRYRFRIAPSVTLDGFRLPMSFFADNSVPEVWVNGVAQSPFQPEELPQSASVPYTYAGFIKSNAAETELTQGFQHGANEIVVRVASNPSNVGFMAEVDPNPLCSDRGDAPNSYGTEGSSGASHGLADLVGSNATELMLGDIVDADGAAKAGPTADGDDTTAADDEDGVSEPLTVTAGQPTTVSVSVTNGTDQAATLAGWIDLDHDGTFEPGERVVRMIAADSGADEYDLTFPAPTTAGDSYARFRVFPGQVTDPAPVGAASAGEVEDYPTTFQAGDPIIGGCTNLITFDEGNEGWRAAAVSTSNGRTVTLAPAPVEWGAQAGNPGGALIEDDLQGNTVTELWTPELVPHGYATDYAPLVGRTIQFDYRNDTGIGLNVYMGIVGANNQYYWFNFRPQITNSRAWNRIRVPMVASQWLTGWGGNAGPDPASAAPTEAQFAAALGDVRMFTFSIEGQAGADRTAFDNFGQLCADFGDAPNSYGTEVGGESASHGVSPDDVALRLGDEVDVEDGGRPGPAADGDDTAGDAGGAGDDEDGLASPIRLNPGEQTTVQVSATNDTGAPATLAGWIDLDGDGTFEAGERVTVPVSAGTDSYDLTFPAGSVTEGSTYARFRIFAGTVVGPAPTGPVATGEVEDYRVAVLRPGLQVEKTAEAPGDPRPGDTIDYTVTLTNTGDGGFTAANPARVVDDLSGLLDDAAFNNDATATIDGTTVTAPTYASPRIRWQGPLGAGRSVVITYSVTLEGGGDGTGRNVAWVPNGPTPGPTPDCDDPATTVPCDSTEFLLPKLTVSKTASRNELPNVGEQITYTVTVRNTGPGAWTAEDPGLVDDLSDVEDDATIVGGPTATSGTATYDADAAELTWSGDLAPDEAATIIYTFTYDGTGDESLVNTACVPADDAADPQDRCRSTTTPGSGLDQAKTSDPASGTAVDEGDEITYTLRFTNTGQTAATVDTTDDLAQVLDDAVLTDGPDAGPGLSVNQVGQTLEIDGSVPVGETRTVTYTVTVESWADQDDHLLGNTLACASGSPASCEPDVTEHPVRRLTVEKAVTETPDDPRPGDQVTYTVSATNEGPGDYTADEPALVLDDLSEVLDDGDLDDGATATIAGDPVTDPTALGSLLSWSDALAAGETVEITYTVTLTGSGDGTVRNTAFAPDCDPGSSVCDPVTPDCTQGTDPDTGLSCATTSFDLPKLSIAKSADPAQVNAAGQVVTYTVVVTNEGPGDYTVAAPATFTDDLSDVLDDATIVDGSVSADVGTPAFADPELSWSGALAAGEDATVTYKVRYTGAGDRSLVNSACVPVEEADVPAEACDAVTVMGSALTQTKTSDPADGESVGVGEEITYTLTFSNDGNAPATVDTTDDLSDVLDDADLVGDPTGEGLTATVDAGVLTITGEVPAGESATVTYTVKVSPFADQGDHVLDNALQCAEGAPADCEPETTSHPVQHLKVTKAAEVPRGVDTGDEVTYTLTVLNDGSAPFTDDDPAVVTDDLTDVLDDAILDEDSVTEDVGATELASPTLTWTGALTPNATATISYTVEVTNLGDHELENTARQAGCPTEPVDAGCAPDPVVTPLPHVVLAKTADPATGTALAAGDVVSYTLTWVNDGEAAGRVETTDDLSDVLDDATVTGGPTPSSDAVTATVDGKELRVEGAIGAGDTVTVTYDVTVGADGERGDNALRNVATPATPQVTCEDGDCTPVRPPTTTHDIGELEDSKSVDPASGTTVVAGQEITYTLTFRNIGKAALEVDREDVLTGVLDDADLTAGPTSSAPGLTASEPLDGRMTISGTLEPEQEVTVSYTVRVRERAERGDHVLANALVDVGQDPPAGCGPAADLAAAAATDCTVNPVSNVRVTKSVDPDSGDPLAPGDQLTYTLTFTNDGAGRGAVDHVDHLEGVLDDADLVEGPDSSSPELDAVVDADELRLSGSVGPDEEVRVTYVVRVKARADLGDGALANYVGVIGEPVPAQCADGSLTCTVNGIAEESGSGPAPDDDGAGSGDPLPDTGGPALWLLALGVLALLGGTALVRRRR